MTDKKPPLPVIYSEAVSALVACRTLDEAKYFADKAGALEAWARIYRDDAAGVEARRLKLYAYRRMATLAEEIAPGGSHKGKGTKGAGSRPGPHKELVKHGFSPSHAQIIRRVGAIPEPTFKKLAKEAVGVNRAAQYGRGFSPHSRVTVSNSWVTLTRFMGGLFTTRAFMRKHSAKVLAAGLASGEAKAARALLSELGEWLDEFEQYMPKESKR